MDLKWIIFNLIILLDSRKNTIKILWTIFFLKNKNKLYLDNLIFKCIFYYTIKFLYKCKILNNNRFYDSMFSSVQI